MGQVLRAVEIERLRTVKRPAGWVPEGAPARKLRAGTGTGLLFLLTEGKRAHLGKGLRAYPIHDKGPPKITSRSQFVWVCWGVATGLW